MKRWAFATVALLASTRCTPQATPDKAPEKAPPASASPTPSSGATFGNAIDQATPFVDLATIQKDPKMLVGLARAIDKGYYFNIANPAAAVKITWKLNPEAEPKNLPPDKALEGGIFVNQERMKIWKSLEAGPGHDGMFLEPQWQRDGPDLLRGTLTDGVHGQGDLLHAPG